MYDVYTRDTTHFTVAVLVVVMLVPVTCSSMLNSATRVLSHSPTPSLSQSQGRISSHTWLLITNKVQIRVRDQNILDRLRWSSNIFDSNPNLTDLRLTERTDTDADGNDEWWARCLTHVLPISYFQSAGRIFLAAKIHSEDWWKHSISFIIHPGLFTQFTVSFMAVIFTN